MRSLPDSVMKDFEVHASTHGNVAQIMRMSTEDGPGLRTTIFFKGCPLRCTWCHNPECLSPGPEIRWNGSRCIGCKICLETCPNQALSATAEGLAIDRTLCRACGQCVDACPSTALERIGQQWEVEALVQEIKKDRAYFERSRGGITLSGGEPTLQLPFIKALLKACTGSGLSIALDTCGECSEEAMGGILPYVDMVLYDLKEGDPDRHRAFTGKSNERIFRNLFLVRDGMKTQGYPGRLWIRTPIIPDATAREENIRTLGEFIGRNLADTVSRWELCSFNNLCRDKYANLGMEWAFKDYGLLERSFMEHLAQVARISGVDPGIVHWSGSTRI